MKRLVLLACGFFAAGVAGCGGPKPEKKEPEQLDPYRSVMSERINAVIYSGRRPAKVLEELALLGVTPGKDFEEFKEESKIDDWFAPGDEAEAEGGPVRYISLTCGLSPVVNEDGKMTRFYRSRKLIDGKMQPEMLLGPGAE
jgi:hypothetical protein